MVNNTPDEQPIKLKFAIKDTIDGQAVTPSNISVALLNDFVKQVADFLKGSHRTDTKQIKAAIEEGSLAVVASAPPAIMADAAADYEKAATSDDISGLDPARRRVMNSWQNLAKQNEGRSYVLSINGKEVKTIIITADSGYHIAADVWADVEKYIYGRVYDLGGKSRANVHIELENGSTITIASDSELLATDKVNRVYQHELLRIRAKQNMRTGVLADEQLVSFENYNPHYDEDQQQEVEEKGRAAWAGINATDWVESLRGNADAV